MLDHFHLEDQRGTRLLPEKYTSRCLAMDFFIVSQKYNAILSQNIHENSMFMSLTKGQATSSAQAAADDLMHQDQDV